MDDASVRPPRTAPGAAPGPRRVTLKDLARELGVSPATVSNAYNRPDQLSPELRARVLSLASRLGYSGPDPLASSLRRGRAGAVGLLYGAPLSYAFLDPAASLFLGGLGRGLSRGGSEGGETGGGGAGGGAAELNLLLLPGGGSMAAVLGASVDGFVVYSAPDHVPNGELDAGGSALAAVLGRGLPAVLVDQTPLPGAASVGIDDYGGALLAARHLLALGHRQIGVLALEQGLVPHHGPLSLEREEARRFRASSERLRAYRDAAREGGARLAVWEVERNAPREAERLARELLVAEPDLTALLCMSDVLAMGALRAAQTLGLSVPAQLSVMGYDDLPLSAALDLSSVAQPTERKGVLAAEALLGLLAGGEATQVVLPTELVVRGSSGPVRAG